MLLTKNAGVSSDYYYFVVAYYNTTIMLVLQKKPKHTHNSCEMGTFSLVASKINAGLCSLFSLFHLLLSKFSSSFTNGGKNKT